MTAITAAPFGKTAKGEPVTAYTLKNASGMTARIIDYGAAVQSLVVPDKNGRPVDVAPGYDDISGYEAGSCCCGAVIGRYAGRIANASFALGGKTYRLLQNEGANYLHGSWHHRIFTAEGSDGALVMTLCSPDGEDGFPGNVTASVTYRLTDENALVIDCRAVTDADTFINLTNHTYFNLAGHGDVLGHYLRLNASRFTELGAGSIPTGRIMDVSGTALDFRVGKPIGRDIFADEPQLAMCRGYDHNYILDKEHGLAPCGEAWCPETGIQMTFSTTQPAVQLYTGNFIDDDPAPCGKGGVRCPRYAGFCLESQHYPDSPNRPGFPSTLLRPNEEYRETTEYKFSIQ